MYSFTATPPLSLYAHIPWCVRKCPYCDFNSHEARDGIPERAYVDALLADLEQDLPGVWGRVVETVFIGGGTPSLFSPEAIDRLLAGVRSRITLAPEAEITLEANPGTVDSEHFEGYREAGVNRLSIGAQSFNNDALEKIGRIHDRRAAIRAAELAHDAGFDNFNLDLMFGLPGQSGDQATADLHTAVDLEPSHISRYELTIEPNTWFHKHPPTPVEDDTLWSMQTSGRALLAEHGFERYEVSAYALTERQCRHNLNYWRYGDYLGIGAGAHGKITDAAQQAIVRTVKQRHPARYMETAGSVASITATTQPAPDDTVLEFMMNALRLDDGFTRDEFTLHTGLPVAIIESGIARHLTTGLLEDTAGRIRATDQGQRFLNDLLGDWLPVEDTHAG